MSGSVKFSKTSGNQLHLCSRCRPGLFMASSAPTAPGRRPQSACSRGSSLPLRAMQWSSSMRSGQKVERLYEDIGLLSEGSGFYERLED